MRRDGTPSREEEDDARKNLLARARRGDVKAQIELMEKYGARIYSDAERQKLAPYQREVTKGGKPSMVPQGRKAARKGKAGQKARKQH